MKKILIAVLALASAAVAQQVPGIFYVTTAPSGACAPYDATQVTVPGGLVYTCQGGTWAQVSGGGSGTVSTFSAGTLSPLFTTSVATATTTPALSFALSNAAANTLLGNFTSGSAGPIYNTISDCHAAGNALTYTAGTGFTCATGYASGTVTSIATTSPITGGTITSTGTLACPTCVVATANPSAGLLRVAGSTQTATGAELSGDVTTSGSNAATVKMAHWTETAITNASSPYAVAATDSVITCDATAGVTTINLPAATGSGRYLVIKKIDSSVNACTPTRAASDTIDGATSYSISTQYASSALVDTVSGTWSRTHVNQMAGDCTGLNTTINCSKANGGDFPTSAKVSGTNSSAQPVAATASNIGSVVTCTGAGTAGAQTATCSPANAALTDGLVVYWKPNANSNSSSPTLAVDGLTATTLTVCQEATLTNGDFFSGLVAVARYSASSSKFEILNPRKSICGSTFSGGGTIAFSNTAVTGINAYTPQGGHLLMSSTAPTISSGFGSSPTIAANNGTAAFTVNVGTGGSATGGVVGMPAANAGWICTVNDITSHAANGTNQTYQTASSTTTVTVQNQTVSTGAAVAWTASDIVQFMCKGY